MTHVTTEESDALRKRGAFIVSLLPQTAYLESRSDPAVSLSCHETVLRPLLHAAAGAWVYELKEEGDTFAAGRTILVRTGRKYRIQVSGEPIIGHEAFWNAGGGKRGSIMLLFRSSELPAAAIFSHCVNVFIANNPSGVHSPAAVRYARAATGTGSFIAAMLSRTNGMQWLSFHGTHAELLPLFELAKCLVTNPKVDPF